MKLKMLSLISSIFLLFSCSSTDNTPENPNENIRYYVKYELDMPSRHINDSKKITFYTENGEQSINTINKSWSEVYGPIKKGTKLYLTCTRDQSDYNEGGYNNARIYVCREKEPFVNKAEDSGAHNINIEYVIDF